MSQPRKPGRPKGTGGPKKTTLNFELPPELKAALKALAKKNDRKITAEAIRALQSHCAAGGTWPPSPKPAAEEEP